MTSLQSESECRRVAPLLIDIAMDFPPLPFPPGGQTGTGKQVFQHFLLYVNNRLSKPAKLEIVRAENNRAISKSKMFQKISTGIDITKTFCGQRNTTLEDIVQNRWTVDKVSSETIPVPDCHVWYEINGKLDDFSPYFVEILPDLQLQCTEYVRYRQKLETAMKGYFQRQWESSTTTLSNRDCQLAYLTKQDMCWMRCGVLHKLNPHKYSLDNLRIGSLGFRFKGKRYWHFG